MKTRPKLFSTPMVQSIEAGRKRKTRRTKGLEKINEFLKGDPHNYSFAEMKYHNGKMEHRITVADKSFVCIPEVEVGDILWVRETWRKSEFPQVDGEFEYKAKMENPESIWNKGIWKPSIFMPKKACRIFLKVTDVSLERLQEISEEDAVAEGIYAEPGTVSGRTFYQKFIKESEARIEGLFTESAKECFKTLWQSINGKGSWKQNPWVWVYSFEKTERPDNFLG